MQNEVQEKISVGSEGISYTRLLWAALLAVLLAAVTNAQVYFAASRLGIVSRGVLLPSPMGLSPLTVGMVVTASVVGAIGAALVFAIIGLLARRPVRLFRIVAAVVLVLSLIPPTTIPSVPLVMRITLGVMHVVTWAVSVGLLTALARRRVSA
jgi:Family of unknown function (DUF6069)